MTGFLLSWVLLFGTYLILVDQLVGPELIAGAISSLLVAAYATWMRRCTERRYGVPRRPKLHLLTLPRDILVESLRMLALALRSRVPEGSTRLIAFDNETGLDPVHDAGRRALVVTRLSASPNGFVILQQDEPGRLLIHDLLPAGPDHRSDPRADAPADPVWPG